jgi:hypothetical protein
MAAAFAALHHREASVRTLATEFQTRGIIMAHGHGSEGGHPDMDYAEHEKTYQGFIRFSVIGVIWCLTIVVGLAIGATGKSWGWGGLMVFLSTIAAAAGILIKSIDSKAALAVFGLSLLIWVATAL